jgi:hypothetical protein
MRLARHRDSRLYQLIGAAAARRKCEFANHGASRCPTDRSKQGETSTTTRNTDQWCDFYNTVALTVRDEQETTD